MERPIRGFWGKTYEDEWHPLQFHCADVGACCEALLTETLLGKRLAAWGGLPGLSEIHIAQLSVIAALHDLGKYNIGFQRWGNPGLGKGPRSGHENGIIGLFQSKELKVLLYQALPQEISTWGDTARGVEFLLHASFSHHGGPLDMNAPVQGSLETWKPSCDLDPFVGIAELAKLLRRWFPLAFLEDPIKLPSKPEFHHGFAGIVTLADWIGSDKERFFQYSQEEEEDDDDHDDHDHDHDHMVLARVRAKTALAKIRLAPARARRSLVLRTPLLQTIADYPKSKPAQELILNLPVPTSGSLTVLEAETGSGKTEAALLYFLKLFEAGEVDGIYFALPTKTAATQIHERVYTAVRRAFQGQHPPVLLAVPGYFQVDNLKGKRRLAFDKQGNRDRQKDQVLWPEDTLWPADPPWPEDALLPNRETCCEQTEDQTKYRGWAAERPKQYLAGSIVVGTIDQVLLSTLMIPHSHLRSASLSRLLLVVDEVHASSVYMNALLESVLQNHLACQGHALLMSATLGSDALRSFVSACGGTPAQSTLEEAKTLEYPLVTHLQSGRITSFHSTSEGTKTVVPILMTCFRQPMAIAKLALDAARKGAHVLVVHNLVRRCVDTQIALESMVVEMKEENLLFQANNQRTPHHSRYAREDRRLLDKHVGIDFDKDSDRSAGCVLVATQTVEQSLDLDADLLITDLCPMDVLLQRIGRLHRHKLKRPEGFQNPQVIVLVPENRDLEHLIGKKGAPSTKGSLEGVPFVYDDLSVLERTWRLCETHGSFQIPKDNRALVEEALHRDHLRELAKNSPRWMAHYHYIRGDNSAQKALAGFGLLDRTAEFRDTLFLNPKDHGRISSRLGGEDLTVYFSKAISPFGQKITNINIPYFLVPPGCWSQAPIEVQTGNGVLTFSLGDQDFIYSRHGLAKV